MKQLFYFLMFCLGIRLFKRYWPVGGSFWNTHHIRKNNLEDLNIILENAKVYTRQHVLQTFLTLIFGGVAYYISDPVHLRAQMITFSVILVLEIYAFLVQLYNYLKATDTIADLQNSSCQEKEDQLEAINESQIFQIEKMDNLGADYGIWCPAYRVGVGKYGSGFFLSTLEESLRFRDFLNNKYGTDSLSILNQKQGFLRKDYVEFKR